MTAPLADLAALEDRLGEGTLSGNDQVRAQALLDDASVLVRDVAGQPDWTAGDAPARAVQIVLAAAQRAYRNPDGLITERIGDASWGYHHGAAPGVYLTKDEVGALRGLAGAGFRSVTNVVFPGLDEG